MIYQIGTDEAGYGPNLGPLTITGTLWQLADDSHDLYQQLDSVITSQRSEVSAKRMIFADSKKVYVSGALRQLELPVLAALSAVLGHTPSNWQQLLIALTTPDALQTTCRQPWLADRELNLPIAASQPEIQAMSSRFGEVCEIAQVRLLKVQCQAIGPEQFNRELTTLGNKASLLSIQTLRIVRQLLNQTDANVQVGCDKHGGRSKYASLIQSVVSPEFVYVGQESLASSDYRFIESDREIKLRFAAKGETFLPTALSSMTSKYLREIFMILWNDFWREQVPGIRPTQGYPQDAKRFKGEISARQKQLGIHDELIWRNK